MREFLSRRRIWTPHRYQFQTTECGVGVLAIVLAYYGRAVPMEEIRRVTGVSRDCLNAADMVAGARAFGLEPKVRRCEPETLAQHGFPVVVHLSFFHFAVVEGITDTHVLLNDPQTGRLDISRASFSDSFTGVAISFTPTHAFQPDPGRGEHDPAPWRLLRPHLVSLAGAVAGQFVAAFALIWLALTAFQGPAALAAAALFAVGLGARNLLLARLRVRLAGDLSEAVLNHILQLDTAALNYRLPSRLAEVIASAPVIARAICAVVLPRWLDVLSVPVLLAGLFLFDPVAAIVVGCLVAVIGLCLAVVLSWQNGRMTPRTANGADPAQNLAHKLARPRKWKFAGADRGFVTDSMADLAHEHLALLNRNASDTANDLVAALALPVLLGGAILWSLIEPKLGAITPVLFLTLAAAIPLSRLSRVRGQWRIANRLLSDVRDVQAVPARAIETTCPTVPPWDGPVLKAQDVSHGFSARKPAQLNAITLSLQAGEQLGITGPSGGGKSTVGRVLAGLVKPRTGMVRFMGQPITPDHRPIWIDKRNAFLPGSLRDNLTLWDDTIQDSEIQAALQVACMDADVKRRPGGLDSVINPRLASFSGGQLQRLEIARAVLRRPKVIILDEALDALNPAIEAELRSRLRQNGISLIVVSHRQSTLAACDRVLTIQNGRISDGLTETTQTAPTRSPMDQNIPRAAPAAAGLQEAFATVAHQIGASQGAKGTTLTELADSSNLLFRAQRFEAEHWRFEHAPMILLDETAGATALFGGQKPRGPDARYNGFVLYDARNPKPSRLAEMIMSALSQARRDLVRVSTLSLCCAGALSLWPLALKQMPDSLTTAVLGLFFAVLALALFHGAHRIAAVRLSQIFQRRLLLTLLLRLRNTRTSALEQTPFVDLLNAARGIEFLGRTVRVEAPAALTFIALILMSLACFTAFQGAGLRPLFFLCGLCIFVPVLATLGLFERAAHMHDAEIEQERLTMSLMTGLARLQSLNAMAPVTEHWCRQHNNCARTAKELWQPLALIRLLPWSIALLGLAVAGVPTHPGAALAGLLALYGAVSLGQMSIDLALAARRLGAVQYLLALPQDAQHKVSTLRHNIEFASVSHGFSGEQLALTDVSTRIAPGKITVVAGASGSGKSTFLDLTLGIVHPVRGCVLSGGRRITDLNPTQRNRRIGAIFQHDHLETASTLRSQISLAELVDVAKAWVLLEQAALADDVAAMPMGLQTIVDTSTISTGQMQRLLIARQLAAAPDLLILDEAMNAVSDEIEAQLITNFRALGLTCLIVTHRESTIRLADKVIVLADGKVVHDGPAAPVLARPEFQRALNNDRQVFLS